MFLVVFKQLESSWQQGVWEPGNSEDVPCQSVVGKNREKGKRDNEIKLKQRP